MKANFFESNFARSSRFHWDFIGNINRLDRWLTLAKLYDGWKINQSKSNYVIPRKIHQIWLGSEVPKKYELWRDSWLKYNKGYEYFLWDEKSILELGLTNEFAFLNTDNLGAKSDIARYEILQKIGGIYVDTDFECLKPFPDNFLTKPFFACTVFSDSPQLNNAIMGSAPASTFINLMVASTGKSIKSNDVSKIMEGAGPIKLTEVFFTNFKKIENEVVIFPSNYFYPWPNFVMTGAINRYDYILDESFAIHHWEVSWIKLSIHTLFVRRIIKMLFNIKW